MKFEPLVIAFFESSFVEAGIFVLRLLGEGESRRRFWGDDFVFGSRTVAHDPVEELFPDVA